jgi:hypothetical protein
MRANDLLAVAVDHLVARIASKTELATVSDWAPEAMEAWHHS